MDRLHTPPNSIEAEQAVLGGLLLDTAAWDQVGDTVAAEDFYRPDHKLIFDSIGELVAESKAIDVVTVSERLERRGKLADVGGLAYLSTLVRDTPTAANVRAYAQIVRERALLRSLISAGNAIVSSVYSDEGLSARELVNAAEARVFEIAERGAGRTEGAKSVRSMLPALIDQIDEWHNNPDSLRGTPSGFTDFDRMTGGLRGGDLVIVAGRPGMGKTTLAINIGENVALDHNVKGTVLIFSMEMPTEQLMTRMLSSVGGVPLHDIRSGRISDQDWARISAATSQLQEARLYIDDQPALTPTDLRARARRVKREHGLHMVIVDYLQLMQVNGTKENRATEISEISRGLKALAKELDVPVIALSQLNRSVEQREGKKPVMSDLRECVTGETLVCLTDGSRVPIRDLVDQTPEVWAVDSRQRIVPAMADKVWRVGTRPVFKVQLASGRCIRATAEHRLLAGEGWTTVAELAAGTRLALSRRVPEPATAAEWPDDELVRLARQVADGKTRMPSQVFRLSNAQVALLLRHLWAADGCIAPRSAGQRGASRIFFATCSSGLADDVAALLLRLGIVARIRAVHDTARTIYSVDVSGESRRLLLDVVGAPGPRVGPGAAFAGALALAPDAGLPHGPAPAPAMRAVSDLFWDRVVKVTPDGEEDVFDLTVPGPACWLADGIVTHNSGAIEQDADMILFIYREEYYDRNSPRKGEADVELAKHRNGETGHFVLTFQGKYTRFTNFMPEAYAEGVLR